MKRIRSILARVGVADAVGASVRPRGFTLIELLVAIGALAFVAVGVAAIFEATGRTISAGKRVSAFSTYANLIEQQMRQDFASMTREGFLVIRNEYAGGRPVVGIDAAPEVELFDGDTRPRARRIDQIMFFAKGSFTTAREPLHPEVIASADSARIYYGHGQKALPIQSVTTGTSRFFEPSLAERPSPPSPAEPPTYDIEIERSRLGYNNPGPTTLLNPPNPNRFASSWILMRHVTLLSGPGGARKKWPSGDFFGNPFPASNATSSTDGVLDSDAQVSLQPAAASLFRSLQSFVQLPASGRLAVRDVESQLGPRFGSGLVDIATTDLREIRQIVTTVNRWPVVPASVSGTQVGPDFYNPLPAALPDRPLIDGDYPGVDGVFRTLVNPQSPYTGADGVEDPDVIRRMHAWMDDGWPTATTNSDALRRERMRCESAPPNYVGATTNSSVSTTYSDPLERAYRRADQIMLSSSNFLPRCTEFIVEWSFGKTYPSDPNDVNYVAGRAGQVIWHGMERRTDTRQSINNIVNSGTPADATRIPEVFPYVSDRARWAGRVSAIDSIWRRRDGLFGRPWPVRTELIHGMDWPRGNNPSRLEPLTSYFGYVDPTFAPSSAAVPAAQREIPAEGTLPWAWPKLIRVTLSLADPGDPSVEQTFQFVFDLPQDRSE